MLYVLVFWSNPAICGVFIRFPLPRLRKWLELWKVPCRWIRWDRCVGLFHGTWSSLRVLDVIFWYFLVVCFFLVTGLVFQIWWKPGTIGVLDHFGVVCLSHDDYFLAKKVFPRAWSLRPNVCQTALAQASKNAMRTHPEPHLSLPMALPGRGGWRGGGTSGRPGRWGGTVGPQVTPEDSKSSVGLRSWIVRVALPWALPWHSWNTRAPPAALVLVLEGFFNYFLVLVFTVFLRVF